MEAVSARVATARSFVRRTSSAFESVWRLKDLLSRHTPRRHPSAPPRARLARGLEQLEDRVVPAQIRWNTTVSGDWSNPNNWDLGRVPTGLDEVIINVAASPGGSRPTVTISSQAEAFEVRTLNPLVISGGSLFAGYRVDVLDSESSLTVNNGSIWSYVQTQVTYSSFTYLSGTITGDLYLHSSAVTLDDSPPAPRPITLSGYCPILSDVPSGFALRALGGATIQTSTGFTNHGTIVLDSLNVGASSGIRVDGGAFTNAADGVLTASLGSEPGPREVRGRFVNYGQVNVDAGTGLRVLINNALPARFEQLGGVVSLGGYMQVIGGWGTDRFDFGGGQILSTEYTGGPSLQRMSVSDVRINVQAGAAPLSPATVEVGGYSTLEGNLSPAVTLRATNGAILTVNAGAVNAGTLALDSFVNQGSEVRLTGTFTNTATGLIDVRPGGGGGRVIRGGRLTNQGGIWVRAGTELTLDYNSSGALWFDQQGGVVALDGAMRLYDGKFDFTGGSIDAVGYTSGPSAHRLILVSSRVNVSAAVTTPATIELTGVATLVANLSPAVTLRVTRSLNTEAGAVNAGTIDLYTLDGNGAELLTTNGMVNAPTGVITAHPGVGGERKVNGGVLTNRGRLTAAPGAILTVYGTYSADGGWVDGPVVFRNVVLQELAPAAQPSVLDLRGFTQLTTDHLAGSTLWVHASDWGSSELRSPTGFTNHGIIVLDSTVIANPAELRTTTGTLINAAGGVIYSNVGVGGERKIEAAIDNRGTINLYAETWVSRSGNALLNSGTVALYGPRALVFATSIQNTGRVYGTGTIIIQGAEFQNDGTVTIDNTAAGRLTVQGNYRQSAAGKLTVRVLSSGGASTFDQLVVTGAATLGGTLDVVRVNGYRPPSGETLPVVTFSSRTGSFAAVTGLNQGGRQVLQSFYNPTDVSLVTIVAAVAPNQPQFGSNLGTATVTVSGTDFTSGAVVKLAAGGVERAATSVLFRDRTTLYATFDLTGLTSGAYDIRVYDHGAMTTVPVPYTVNSGPVGYLETALVGQSTVRQGLDGQLRVEYVNAGNTDIPAPLLELQATNALLKLLGEDAFGGSTRSLLAINPNGPAGVLAPGAGGSFTFVYNPEHNSGDIDFDLSTIDPADRADPMNWSSLSGTARPADIPQASWDAVWANFTAGIGTTVGDYLDMLADNATYLSGVGQYVSDPDRLLLFEFGQANGALYGEPLTSRYTLGVFGRGQSAPWDVSLRLDPSGNAATVIAGDPGEGNRRLFLKGTDGAFHGLDGDSGVIQLQGGLYRLTERDGSVTAFRADGKLDHLRDANGNQLTAGYTADRLTSMTDNSGGSLTVTYNSFGRVETATDEAGRVTTYTYDPSGEHLTQVATAAGTLTYTYVTGQGAAREHAVATVTGPDGVTYGFSYDSLGRLAATTQIGLTGSVTYTYDGPGGVTVTAPDGTTTSYRLLDSGQVGWMRDALGRDWVTEYDNAGNPVGLTGPNGLTGSATFNAFGQATGVTDIANRTAALTYDPAQGWLTSFGDGPNSQTFTYDSRGNLTGLSYALGGALGFDYDPVTGDLVQSTNLRSQSIEYTYNARGQLTRKDYPGGSFITYTYDVKNRLETVTDASGTTTFTYDVADRVTRVDYPGGRWVGYHYDAAGRRDQLTGPNGYEVNYVYDTAGRIWKLTDSTGTPQVTYSYDPANGRMTRKDLANGTYTTYAYDAAGRLEHLVNYAPGGAVNSRFDYTFDALGRVETVTTLDGTTTYGYNAAGELTSVELPGGRLIEYAYDAHGNRTTVTDSGATTSYTTNGVSQYTAVGGWTYTYDLDGNLTRKDGPNGEVFTYTYDAENRMTGSTGPDGTFAYEYDAFGNRVATVHNGVRTEYLLDLFGTVDVLAEYDGAGNVAAAYTQGLGLVSRSAGGSTAFYDFDMLGSTTGLTDGAGAYVNRYGYLPFGESTLKTEAVDNPFQYVGEYGVTADGNGLYYMRERFYDPATGRFVERDPAGLAGGRNPYSYTENQPTTSVDPQGTTPAQLVGGAVIGGIWGGAAYLLSNKPEDRTASGLAGAIFNGAVTGAVTAFSPSMLVASAWGAAGGFVGNLIEQLGSGKGVNGEKLRNATLVGAAFGALAATAGDRVQKMLGNLPGGAVSTRSLGNATAGLLYNGAKAAWNGVARAFGSVGLTLGPVQKNFVNSFLNNRSAILGTLSSWLSQTSKVALDRNVYALTGIGSFTSSALFVGLEQFIDNFVSNIIRAFDPNDMVGPAGSGPENRVEASEELPYTIRFENLPTATASAQVVRITQTLDEHLDPASFVFSEYGWGNRRFNAPAGVTSFRERHDLRAELGLFVDVEAVFDPATATLTWTFTAIDPRTMQVPSDERGFLPVNTADRTGEGFVSYTVRARDTVQIGDVIYAQARIVFDHNEPIDTPLIFNTIGPRLDESQPEGATGDTTLATHAVEPVDGRGAVLLVAPPVPGTELTTPVLFGVGTHSLPPVMPQKSSPSALGDVALPRGRQPKWFSPSWTEPPYPASFESPDADRGVTADGAETALLGLYVDQDGAFPAASPSVPFGQESAGWWEEPHGPEKAAAFAEEDPLTLGRPIA